VGSLALFRVLKAPEPFLAISSPKGTYLIQFTGHRDRPKLPLVNHQVDFSVTKNQQVYLANRFVHSADWMDMPFDLAYPDYRWLSENILQLYDAESFNSRQTKIIRVINKTSRRIQYVRVKSNDSFLLLDIQPGSTTILEVTARADFRWIEVEGGFSNDRLIKSINRDFDVSQNYKGPLPYDIVIDDNGVSIVSAE
jgi:hypothetical protein